MNNLKTKINKIAIKTDLFPELNWFQKTYNKIYVTVYNLFHKYKESKGR